MSRKAIQLICGLCASLWVANANASPITTPLQLAGLQTTTINFENLSGLDGQQFGFGAGQPYTAQGLTMNEQIVAAHANMLSTSGGVAVRSAQISSSNNSNFQILTLTGGTRAVAMFVQDPLSTGVELDARGSTGQLLESVSFFPAVTAQFIGFLRPTADIFSVTISAPHATLTDASNSRTLIDDVTFSPVPEPSTLAAATLLLTLIPRRRITR